MKTVTLFLAGDVMVGRGIDQILPSPGNPEIHENYVTLADEYVALAERAHGPIKRPVDFSYVWGDALQALVQSSPQARIINLETAITSGGKPELKGINYRINPDNIAILTVAGIDCCVLSNNHVKDWGEAGLHDTLKALKAADIRTAGAGMTCLEASEPAIVDLGSGRRMVIYGVGSKTSGIPTHWAAGKNRPGVRLLPDLSRQTAEQLADDILARKRDGDVTVISVHWGANWGYEISEAERNFAHALIDLGACDILHGHSSHHMRAIEIYRKKLVLFGCGDFINDYEGIRGYEAFRGDLSVMYLPRIDLSDGAVAALDLIIFQMRRFRLKHASVEDTQWLRNVLNSESRSFGIEFIQKENRLEASWT